METENYFALCQLVPTNFVTYEIIVYTVIGAAPFSIPKIGENSCCD